MHLFQTTLEQFQQGMAQEGTAYYFPYPGQKFPTWAIVEIQRDPAFKKTFFKKGSEPVSYTMRPFLC